MMTMIIPTTLCILILLLPRDGRADMLPNPNTYTHTNPDGSTCFLHLLGDSEFTLEADEDYFTVIDTPDGWKAYAIQNSDTGVLEATNCNCGTACNPAKIPRIHKYEKPSIEKIMEDKADCLACRRPRDHPLHKFIQRAIDKKHENHNVGESGGTDIFNVFEQEGKIMQSETSGGRRKAEEAPTHMRNLVVAIRFADHRSRFMPPLSDYNILFNKLGGDSRVCDTGSVRDVFRFNSYEEFDLVSTVAPLVDVTQTEKYCADGKKGIGRKTQEALRDALTQLDNIIDFSQYDEDDDGWIDAISFVHSGYGAEFGGKDCFDTEQIDRIWSHQWRLLGGPWVSPRTGVKVHDYHLTSGLWGRCFSEIARIGVIAHETGHFLGLPDLYDGLGGSGIGSFGLMGNSWGFDGQQTHPPMLTAWSKIELGWVDAVPIEHDGTYYLDPIHSNREVYVIKERFAENEYLLIENRQRSNNPYVFEDKLPQTGLTIFHIDDDSSDSTEGHPGQDGWPQNKMHYRVALLQADGEYDLETKQGNRGDAGDVFHGNGVHSIGPAGTSAGDEFPNTNSYGGPTVVATGIHIHSISPSRTTMSFQVSGLGRAPAPVEGQLATTLAGGNYQKGNMFDLRATQSIIVDKMDLNIRGEERVRVMIFSRTGSYVGHERNSNSWVLQGDITVIGRGEGNPTRVQGFNPIRIDPNSATGVYVTLADGILTYSSSGESGEVFADNGVLSMTVGTGNRHAFQQFWNHRVFNGKFYYTDIPETPVPTKAPSPMPTPRPTQPANQQRTDITGPQSVSTPFLGGNGQAGVMFDVRAIDSLDITSIDINSESTNPSYIVEIWTTEGSYVGHEETSNGWKSHGVITVEAKGEGNPTVLAGFNPIEVKAGQTRGIYITDREGDIKYSSGQHGQGAVLAEDEHFQVLEGSGCRYQFGKTYTPRAVNANFHYKLTIGASSPGSSKTDDSTLEPKVLTTRWDADNGQAGNMFDIKPFKKMKITSFDLHCDKTEIVRLKIYMKEGSYSGFEATPSAWGAPICETNVMGKGYGNPTPVPNGCFDPVTVDASTVYSFYVTFTIGSMEYTKDDYAVEGDILMVNSDLAVYKGVGIRYEFGGTRGMRGVYRTRLWNGNIKYTILDEAPIVKADLSGFLHSTAQCHMKDEPCGRGSDCCVGFQCKNTGLCDYMVFGL